MATKDCVKTVARPHAHDAFGPGTHESGDAGRTVMGRIAAIMEAFDQGEQVLSLVELSQRAHLPKSTVHRLAEQMRDASAGSSGTTTATGSGCGCSSSGVSRSSATSSVTRRSPTCTRSPRKTGLAVQLGVLDRGEVVYLERVVVDGFRLPTRLGGRMPAYCTGLGKSMLAFDDSAAEAVLGSELRRRTENTITEPDLLRSNLAQVRASGVAFDLNECVRGVGVRRRADPQLRACDRRRLGDGTGRPASTGMPLSEAVQLAATNIWNARFGAPAFRQDGERRAPPSRRSKVARTVPSPVIEAS